jgi:SAM-dependent methyltransferase
VAGQNVYDDEDFFTRYQAMREAQAGINEAVEQPALRALLPPLSGRAVIDLGCGDGRLSRDLASRGAASVVGVDPSERMLALAAARTMDDRVGYLRAFAEDAELPAASADLVVSSLAFHYVADLDRLMARIVGWLRPGGWLVASMEHPVMTAAPELGRNPCIVDHYADEGKRDTSWFIDGVVKYHRRLSTILNSVIGAGLIVAGVVEPTPTVESLQERPDLARHRDRPTILMLSATKPRTG